MHVNVAKEVAALEALYTGAVAAVRVFAHTAIGAFYGSRFAEILGFYDGWMTTGDLNWAFQESADARKWGLIFGALEGVMNATLPCSFMLGWNLAFALDGLVENGEAAFNAYVNGDANLAMWKAGTENQCKAEGTVARPSAPISWPKPKNMRFFSMILPLRANSLIRRDGVVWRNNA